MIIFRLIMVGAIIMYGIILGGCKKYEEDDIIHLFSAKSRLTGEWLLKESGSPGAVSPVPQFSSDAVWKYRGNGTSTFTLGYYLKNHEWEFIEKRNEILITKNGPDERFKILKLTHKAFWYTDETLTGGIIYEYHYEKKLAAFVKLEIVIV